MDKKFIDEIRDKIGSSLPVASGIVGRVIKIIYEDSSNAKDLADVIEHDPPLTARIIKNANSAYYGSSTQINSLQRAVVVLGYEAIKEIVTTATVLHYFFESKNASIIDRPGLWIHSVGTAKAAQLISEHINKDRPDISYTVGLLHDIGKILLAVSFPEQYGRVIELAAEKKCRIILAERKILNLDHTMIGELLCDIWNLPDEISSAISFHHDLRGTTITRNLQARIVNLANNMCRKAKIGNPGDDLIPAPSRAALSILGTSQEKIKYSYNIIFEKLIQSKTDIDSFFIALKQ